MKTVFPGFYYFFQGIKWLIRPGLKRFVAIPLAINLILFSLFIIFGFQWIHHLTGLLPHAWHWLIWIIYPIFFVAASTMIIYTFVIVANLIGAPFNSLLSEKVYILATGEKPNQDEGILDALRDMPRFLKREWKKIKYYLPRGLFLLILNFIPVINVISSLLWFIFGCWMMSIEYTDYAFDNHRIAFKEIHPYLRTHCLMNLSFGCCVVIFSFIPIINFIVMPVAVIGATLMYIDHKPR